MSDEGTTSTVATSGSTVPRRQLGRFMKKLRAEARLSVRTAAEALEWSETKMWRIETGQTSLRSLDVKAMCALYGADEEETEGLMALAKETKAKGWWVSYSDVIPEWLDLYIGLEEAAAQIQGYESELVPGLLQTERYARVLIQTDNPGVDPDEIERRVQVRMARQMLLGRRFRPLVLHVVLNEAILHRPVGGTELMVEQLRRLIELGQLPNVCVRVMPFSAGLHYGIMSGPFVKLEFPLDGNGRPTEPSTIYIDSFTGALFLEKSHEIERYATAFAKVWDSSLSEVESTNYISKVAREM
ncbi:helix-turn-helix domain-containing protein [Actinokineospora iranica]|uniref:Helix-turn-helix domain-containing protein n=1 Tax=Actinokineospora iranica TaxID=1271860 RepID=A0A1G6T1K1_9PSEU|nr:helix-turn-helix transcriptional regulator [Actinokineospora iranica]SDD22367.1 Helix-turn-helix domain-containing protein [Actinokineospora iranica]